MKMMRPTEVRNQWPRILRAVGNGEEEILIPLKGDRKAFLLPGELYESLLATIETLSDPEAMRAIRKDRAGKGKTYPLPEIDRLIGDEA